MKIFPDDDAGVERLGNWSLIMTMEVGLCFVPIVSQGPLWLSAYWVGLMLGLIWSKCRHVDEMIALTIEHQQTIKRLNDEFDRLEAKLEEAFANGSK